MNSNDRQEPGGGGAGGFHTVQPLRDLQSNWAVDLAKNLEQYLLKICSGEIAGDENGQLSVNFSEAALLLQGSIQVYSRKVEYLYSLVQHALEFISQKRQHDQPEDSSIQPEENSVHAVHDEENDLFWGSDDILVEAKNLLDSATSRDTQSNAKPPANLVILEGDCLDATGDGSELESYLLATSYLYCDFILLDPCDAETVNDYFKVDKVSKGQNGTCRGSSRASKYRKSFQSPINASGGTGRKLSTGKKQDANPNSSPSVDDGFKFNDFNAGPVSPTWDIPQNNIHEFEMDDRYSDPGNSDDEDDPWKPLNPHEPGNLRVVPFKKVKSFRRQAVNSSKCIPITTQFPLAKLHGIISSELNEVWEARHCASERQASQSPSLYEKLRHSLVHGGHETCNAFHDPKGDSEENEYDDGGLDFGPDFDIPESEFENEEVPLHPEKHEDAGVRFDINEVYGHENSGSQASLEDLCRSHLDALLASIAETEKQTEMAARVSTWKQRIEKNLEEQDSHPPFDIHEYGERVLEKLSLEADGNTMPFVDVVRGQEKYDVARTFSALLQLVNNGNVDLDRVGGDSLSVCYSGVNPFYVRLLGHDRKREEVQIQPSKKRTNSPTRKVSIRAGKNRSRIERQTTASLSTSGSSTSTSMSSHLNCELSLKLGKVGSIRCTPENKRRRKSRLIEPVDLHSAR